MRNRDSLAARYVKLRAVASSQLDVRIEPPAGEVAASGRLKVKVRIRTPRVGQHGVHGLALEVHGASGLFEVPLTFANPYGIEVLPRPFATYLMQPRGGRSHLVAASGRPGRTRGEGSDLRELREHQPGDPFRRIAWKASAKRGQLMVRDFEREERDVVLDGPPAAGRALGRPARPRPARSRHRRDRRHRRAPPRPRRPRGPAPRGARPQARHPAGPRPRPRPQDRPRAHRRHRHLRRQPHRAGRARRHRARARAPPPPRRTRPRRRPPRRHRQARAARGRHAISALPSRRARPSAGRRATGPCAATSRPSASSLLHGPSPTGARPTLPSSRRSSTSPRPSPGRAWSRSSPRRPKSPPWARSARPFSG